MSKRTRRIKKLLFWIVIILFVIISSSAVYVYFKAEQTIKNKISEWVDIESNHLYQLSIKDVNIKFAPLTLSVEDLELITNEDVANEFRKKFPDKVLYQFHSRNIRLEAINWRKLWKERILHCKNLSIYDPQLELTGENILETDSVNTFDGMFEGLQPVFRNTLKKVTFDEVNLINANYEIYASPADLLKVSNAKNISLTIKNFSTDSSLIFNKSKLFNSDDIILKMNNFSNSLGDSLHVFTIDTLEYSLRNADVFVHGFHLYYSTKNSEKNLFDVVVPLLHFRSKSISRLTLSDSLDFDYLEFENPVIKFYQKENHKKINIDVLNKFNLFSLVENQFTKIETDSFLLKNANIEIYHQPDFNMYQQHLKSVNIMLNDFKLDSVSSKDPDRLFHASEINMEVNDYHLRLEDNMHEFRADSLFVSTISNKLGARNIKISPLETDGNQIRNQINVECKKLDIDQVNLKTIYHERLLPTRLISVVEPSVTLNYHTEIQKLKKETGLLFELVQAYLKGVYSEVVLVENGSLKIEHFQNKQLLGYFESGFNFALSGFSLDSTSIEKTDKFFYATDFDLRFSDYEMKLIDNLHKLQADSIAILSTDRKLEITNLKLEPAISNVSEAKMKELNKSELYNIYVPKITLQGIMLRDAFFHNTLTMNSFHIVKPLIYFENYGGIKQQGTSREFEEFYQLIFNYIYDFNIKDIVIPNGEFTWVNHTRKGKTISFDNGFSATLNNFRLNESELDKKRLLFSDDFDISVLDQNFLLSDSVHILHAAEINLSTVDQKVSIKDASLYPDINSENYNQLATTYQFAIPALVLSNIDFAKAYWSKDLLLDKLDLDNPKFRIYSKKGLKKSLDLNKFKVPMPSEIHSVKINELNVTNGQVITYETDENKQEIGSTFNLNLNLPGVIMQSDEENRISFSTQNLVTKITNFSTSLNDLHELEINTIDFNREEKELSVANFNVIPTGQINSGNRFAINVPKLQITGFDINPALEDNNFLFDKILVNDPEIEINVIDSIKGDKFEFTKNLDLYPYIKPYVNKLVINQLDLENVDLNFNWFRKKLVDRKFNISFENILINETQQPENLLHAREFEVTTTGLQTDSKNGMYRFSADSLLYNSARHNVLLKNIAVKPLLDVEEFNQKSVYQADYVQATTTNIEIIGVDESLWLQNNILDAASLIIGKTDATIFRNKRYPFNVNQRPPWPQDLLLSIRQPFVFDSLVLAPSKLIYSELNEISDEPGMISFDQLEIKTSVITNLDNILNRNPKLTIWASSKIMNHSLLATTFNFNLTSKNYAHTVTGKLQSMSMKPFNTIIEKSAAFSIETGTINRFDFSILLYRNNSTGELFFGFDEFKINVLNIDEEEIKKSKFASFWANKMMLNTKNPKGKDELEPIQISYGRDEQRSIINFWWKSIFSAVKQAIGIKDEN